jgi:biopolymer transport protein ExbB
MIETTQPLTASDPGSLSSMFDMVRSGGPVIWPLGLFSIIAVAFAVERTISLRSSNIGGDKFGRQVVDAMNAGGTSRAMEVCETRSHSMARVLVAGLRRADFDLVERDKAVEDAGMREVRLLSANLRPLLVVAVLSPLLGLLGTVWGMILAFGELATASGKADPEQLADGISQALTTTAVGLAVAIPAQAAYYWFRARVDKFVRHVEAAYHEISEILVHGPQPIAPIEGNEKE